MSSFHRGAPVVGWCPPRSDRGTHHGLIAALTSNNVLTFADKGYQGAGGTVWTPFKRRRTHLSRRQKSVNRHHASIRALGERAVSS